MSARVEAALRTVNSYVCGHYGLSARPHACLRCAAAAAFEALFAAERELANCRDWAERDRPQSERMRR